MMEEHPKYPAQYKNKNLMMVEDEHKEQSKHVHVKMARLQNLSKEYSFGVIIGSSETPTKNPTTNR